MLMKYPVLLLPILISSVVGLYDFEKEHMKEAHGIEINDEVTFFKLHDLDGDGYWDESELNYMFGIEHGKDPDSKYIKATIARLFQEVDLNKDRLISVNEYMKNRFSSVITSKDTEEPKAKDKTKEKPKDKTKKDSKPKKEKPKKEKAKPEKEKEKGKQKINNKKGKKIKVDDEPMFVRVDDYKGIPLKFRA